MRCKVAEATRNEEPCSCETWVHKWNGLLLLNCTCKCHIATRAFDISPENDCRYGRQPGPKTQEEPMNPIDNFTCKKCGWCAGPTYMATRIINFGPDDVVYCPKECCGSKDEHLHVTCPRCGANEVLPVVEPTFEVAKNSGVELDG